MNELGFTAYQLTLAIEVPFLVALAWAAGWRPGERLRIAAAGIVASGLTHPTLWGVWNQVLVTWTDELYVRKVILLELGVASVEAVVLALLGGLGWKRGVIASVLANAVSTLYGLVT